MGKIELELRNKYIQDQSLLHMPMTIISPSDEENINENHNDEIVNDFILHYLLMDVAYYPIKV